jgi:hypothetical protein
MVEQPENIALRDRLASCAPVTMFDAAMACGFHGLEADRMTDRTFRVTVFAVMAVMRYEYADAMIAVRATAATAAAEAVE